MDQIIIIITVFSVLSAIFLLLRLWTRVKVQHLPLRADDWVIILAWVFSLAYGIDVCIRKNMPPLVYFPFPAATS